MRAGRLNKRITIQQYTATRNTFGEEVKTWATLATRWASVEPLNGREYFEAQRTTADVSVRFRLRYDATVAAVAPKMRVSYDSRTFDIESAINVDERGRELILMCRESV